MYNNCKYKINDTEDDKWTISFIFLTLSFIICLSVLPSGENY